MAVDAAPRSVVRARLSSGRAGFGSAVRRARGHPCPPPPIRPDRRDDLCPARSARPCRCTRTRRIAVRGNRPVATPRGISRFAGARAVRGVNRPVRARAARRSGRAGELDTRGHPATRGLPSSDSWNSSSPGAGSSVDVDRGVRGGRPRSGARASCSGGGPIDGRGVVGLGTAPAKGLGSGTRGRPRTREGTPWRGEDAQLVGAGRRTFGVSGGVGRPAELRRRRVSAGRIAAGRARRPRTIPGSGGARLATPRWSMATRRGGRDRLPQLKGRCRRGLPSTEPGRHRRNFVPAVHGWRRRQRPDRRGSVPDTRRFRMATRAIDVVRSDPPGRRGLDGRSPRG